MGKAGRVLALVALAVSVCAACSQKPQTYETGVTIVRTQVVPVSKTKLIDVELEYTDCPGEQQEIFQSDAAFADCVAKYKVGEKVQATIKWPRLPDGHYDSEVERVGDCARKRDANDERSYEVVHECHDILANGVVIGFHCDRRPTPELLAKCPWFRRT